MIGLGRQSFLVPVLISGLFFTGASFVAAEESHPEDSGGTVAVEFVPVPGGSFTMGSPEDAYPTFEIRERQVEVSPFKISRFEITNAQYIEFCEDADYEEPPIPSWYDGVADYFEEYANFPVVNVSWYDAEEFCKWFSETTGTTVRLPTEAEWERCARFSESDETPVYPWGDTYPHHHGVPHHDYANIVGKLDHFSHSSPVGFYPRGAALVRKEKVFDLIGNVSEWCLDRFAYDPFEWVSDDIVKDPTGPAEGFRRVVKGSCFRDDLFFARPAFRRGYPPVTKVDTIGFRIVREID